MSMIITAIVVAVIMLMFFSGMFFIKSIVLPIRSINSITRRYATGDFSERLEKKRNDELVSFATLSTTWRRSFLIQNR